jgi:hypothetical protein
MAIPRTQRLVAGAILTSALFFAGPIFAAEYGGIGGRPANPQPENPRTESIFVFELDPSEKISDGVRVINNTGERKTLLVFAADALVSSGGAFGCRQQSEPKLDVGSWITLEKSEVTLEPMTNEIVPFTIQAPATAGVGEHNGCILIQEKKEPSAADGNGIMLSFRTGLRVAVLVPGEVVRKLEIAGFGTQAKPDGAHIAVASIRNVGNVSIDADVRVQASSVFGPELASAGGQYPILRDETSELNFEIPRPFWGGWYRTELTVAYDAAPGASIGMKSGQPLTELKAPEAIFFAWPSPAAGAIELAALAALLALIVGFIRGRRLASAIRTTWTDRPVAEGEDINAIAKERGVDWQVLAKANGLKPPYTLKAGDRLKVPPPTHP